MLVTSIWCIVSCTGRSITMNGAFAGHGPGHILPVVSAAAKVIDEQGQVCAAIAHEVLYDDNPLQVESLLSTHQSLSNPSNAIAQETLEATWVLNLLTLITRIFPSTLMGRNVSLK